MSAVAAACAATPARGLPARMPEPKAEPARARRGRRWRKIDAAVALVMALGRAMLDEPAPGIEGFLANPVIF
jgi:hypothetical protein